MAKDAVYGLVSADEWRRIGEEDERRRAAHYEGDFAGSVLTAVSGLIILAMLAVGPVWTLIQVVGRGDEHSAAFETMWLIPFALTFAAALPLALALRREPSRGRWILVGFLGLSLAIQLATCPWL